MGGTEEIVRSVSYGNGNLSTREMPFHVFQRIVGGILALQNARLIILEADDWISSFFSLQ